MKSQKLRLWLAAFIFLIAVGIIIYASIPAPRWQQVIPLPPVILPEPSSWLLGWKGI
jgi:hypothetical protein